MSNSASYRGLTLIEAVVSLMIIATMGVAALRAFSAATLTRALAQDRARGVALARDLMEEIAAAPYGEPMGGEETENRLAFTTVGAYDGWSASPPIAIDGSPVASAMWRRDVMVRSVELDGATPAAAGSGMVRITVRIFKGTRLVATEESLRTAAWDAVIGGGP